MSDAMNTAISALGALGTKLDVNANNIANIDTAGFKKSRALLQETNSSGVIITIHKVETPGSPIPAEDGTMEMRESSNVAIDEEIVDLKTTQHAYNANLKTIEAEDDMLGTLFDSLG